MILQPHITTLAIRPAMPNSHRRKLLRLRTLVRASELLNSSLDLAKILRRLLGYTTRHLNAETGTIYLLDREKKELWARISKARRNVEIRLPLGQGIAGHVAQTGKTVRVRDAYEDKRFFRGIDKQSGFRTKSMLCMPMRDKAGRIIGVFQILNKKRGVFSREDEWFLRSVSIPATIAIENARLHKAEIESQKVQRDLELAAAIQQQILPKKIPSTAGVSIGAMTRPCRAVGGDFYDIMDVGDQKLVLAIADVSGKGVAGALLVSSFQAALHAYAEFGLPLRETAERLNRIIYEDSTPEGFITCVLCVYDTVNRTLRYVNAGHNFPLVFNRTGGFSQLEKGGIGLGMFPSIPFEEGEIQLHQGDSILLYTDGVTEAMNRDQDLYGEARLCVKVGGMLDDDVDKIVQAVFNDVERFAHGVKQVDDLTMLLMKVP